MTDWFGSLKSKVKDITQKLTTPVKFRHLLNYKLIFFLIIIIAIAVVVVFSQYPQVLTSFAKPPQQPCGFSDTRCCAGGMCNAGLACYSPDNTTPKKCKSNSAVCGNAVDRPCCESTISDEQDNYCNGNLACDAAKNPPYPYQNPWDSGLCALNYNVCGGQNEVCCGTIQDNPIDRCDSSYHCIYGDTINDQLTYICGYVTIDTTFSDYVRINLGSPGITFGILTNIIDEAIIYNVDCGNGQKPGEVGGIGGSFVCSYNSAGVYIVRANVQGNHDPQPVAYLSRHVVVVDPNTTPTPRPTRRPTPRTKPTPGSRSTPTSVPPTSSYTCSGTCLPNGEDCYQRGQGSCQSSRFCCQTIDRPPAATPTTSTYTCNGTCLPNGEDCYQTGSGTCQSSRFCCQTIDRPPAATPTKAPNGAPCSSASQCISAICKTCPGETQGYCRPNGYTCPL